MPGSASDLLTSLWINTATSVALLIGFALLKNQPLNFRVYFPRWYVNDMDERVNEFVYLGDAKGKGARYVNRSWRSYLHTMDWIWSTLRMTEAELIELVGLDSTVFLRIFLFGLKVFVPMLVWGCVVLIPVNKTDNELAFQAVHKLNFTYSEVDTLSIANVHDLSARLWAHLLASYLFTGWTCLMLYFEYLKVEKLRFDFIASQKKRPDQFTVLVRQVPRDKTQSVGLRIKEFFRENHSEHYVTHQVVYKAKDLTKLMKKKESYEGKLERFYDFTSRNPAAPRPTVKKSWYHMRGERLDAIEYYEAEVDRLEEEIKVERKKILSDEKYVMRAGFVSFNSRWGAAVCAQTQQSKDHTKWLTEWAPEPRDVYWNNLALPYMMLNFRRLIISLVVFALVFFYFIPVAFVQSLANLDSLNKWFPFLKPVTKLKFVTSFIQGYLPGLLMKAFLAILPFLLMALTKFEGHVSYSKIDKYAAFKYHIFMIVNVFFGNVLLGSLFEQFKQYLTAPATIPNALGVSIPMKATFFMTYIMFDGWTSNAAEIFRLLPLLIYHLQNSRVQTDKERVKVIPATPPQYNIILSRVSLYFLLGLVYAIISPLILPFLCVYFALGYIVYRNQVINVYEPRYESAAAYWPFVHRNIILALLIKQIALIGLFSIKQAVASTPFLLPLPCFTIIFHLYCCQKFLPAFKNYPLEEARRKDKQDPPVDVKNFLELAYLHRSIKLAPPMESDSDDDEMLKNGTAPRGGGDDADDVSLSSKTPQNFTAPVPPKESENGSELEDISIHPQTNSRHICRDENGSNIGSNRRPSRVHADDSPFLEAGGGSSHQLHLAGSRSLPSDDSNAECNSNRLPRNRPFRDSSDPVNANEDESGSLSRSDRRRDLETRAQISTDVPAAVAQETCPPVYEENNIPTRPAQRRKCQRRPSLPAATDAGFTAALGGESCLHRAQNLVTEQSVCLHTNLGRLGPSVRVALESAVRAATRGLSLPLLHNRNPRAV